MNNISLLSVMVGLPVIIQPQSFNFIEFNILVTREWTSIKNDF